MLLLQCKRCGRVPIRSVQWPWNDATSRRHATTATALVRSGSGSGQRKPTKPFECTLDVRIHRADLDVETYDVEIGIIYFSIEVPVTSTSFKISYCAQSDISTSRSVAPRHFTSISGLVASTSGSNMNLSLQRDKCNFFSK